MSQNLDFLWKKEVGEGCYSGTTQRCGREIVGTEKGSDSWPDQLQLLEFVVLTQ